MPAIRRFRFDSERGCVVEVPLTPAETALVNSELAHLWRTIGIDPAHLPAHGQAVWFAEDHPEPVFIRPVVNPARINLESLLGLFALLDHLYEIDHTAPGAEAGREGLEKTLVDLARAGKKDDFYFLAQASAGVPQAKLDELWTGARQRLRMGA